MIHQTLFGYMKNKHTYTEFITLITRPILANLFHLFSFFVHKNLPGMPRISPSQVPGDSLFSFICVHITFPN